MRRNRWHLRRWMVTGILLGFLPVAAAGEDTHLRFFKRNREFILRAFESQPRQPAGATDRVQSWDFDPFAPGSVQARVQGVRAALDTATTPEHLVAFRDAVGGLLDDAGAAGTRLDDLDRRFRAHLRTAVEVTLAATARADVERVEAWLDGQPATAFALAGTERAALAAGGVLEVLRRVVEPRAQSLEVHVWLSGHAEPVRIVQPVSPVADALVCLRLEVEGVGAPIRVQQTTLGADL